SAASGSWRQRPGLWRGMVSRWQSISTVGAPWPTRPTALPAPSTTASSNPSRSISPTTRCTIRSSRPGVLSILTRSRRNSSSRGSSAGVRAFTTTERLPDRRLRPRGRGQGPLLARLEDGSQEVEDHASRGLSRHLRGVVHGRDLDEVEADHVALEGHTAEQVHHLVTGEAPA